MPKLNPDTYHGEVEGNLLDAIATYAEYMVAQWDVGESAQNDPLRYLVFALRSVRGDYPEIEEVAPGHSEDCGKREQVERLRSVLSELVTLKDQVKGADPLDYERRKPLAWKNAREALEESAPDDEA